MAVPNKWVRSFDCALNCTLPVTGPVLPHDGRAGGARLELCGGLPPRCGAGASWRPVPSMGACPRVVSASPRAHRRPSLAGPAAGRGTVRPRPPLHPCCGGPCLWLLLLCLSSVFVAARAVKVGGRGGGGNARARVRARHRSPPLLPLASARQRRPRLRRRAPAAPPPTPRPWRALGGTGVGHQRGGAARPAAVQDPRRGRVTADQTGRQRPVSSRLPARPSLCVFEAAAARGS